jgi:hypothetical protein
MTNHDDGPGRITFAEEDTQGARIKVVGWAAAEATRSAG